MLINSETIRTLAPDDDTLKRAERISDVNKWAVAAFANNLLWGKISGSGAEDYSVMICTEPLHFHCDCPVRVQPCKHSLALLTIYTNNVLTPEEIPSKVALWAEKKLGTKSSGDNQNIDFGKDTARDKRNKERLELMRLGVEDLEKWLFDLMAQGLANVAHANDTFWENSAARFKDSKLGRVAFTVREIADELSAKTTDYNDIAIKIGELSLLVSAFKNIEQLSNEMQEELLNQLGRLIRKNDVIEHGNSIKDFWIVTGQTEHFNLDGLLERRVWLQGKNSKQIACLLDFLFQGDFALKFNIGDTFESELYFYPGTTLQRALINNSEITVLEEQFQFQSFSNLEDFISAFSRKIKLNPWLTQDQAIVENLKLQVKSGKAYLCDEHMNCLPLINFSQNQLFKLLAIAATNPITLSIIYSNKGLEILAYLKGNTICAL